MSLVIQNGSPVHVPANRDRFEFDNEVACVFENMAQRSIPLYADMHRIHAGMAAEHVKRGRRSKHVILDVGASTGTFYKTLAAAMGFGLTDDPWSSHGLRCFAIDTSTPMLEKIQGSLPWVETRKMYGHQMFDQLGDQIPGGVDIICMHYLLQFVPKSFKEPTIRAAFKLLRKNGMLFLGQKEAPQENSHKMVSDELERQYIAFRLANGYTPEEIRAKTKALKGSMWLSSGQSLRNLLYRVGFDKLTETTRWCQFSSSVCVKT